jgi:hypothetical protein
VYGLVHSLGTRKALAREAATLILSLGLAEAFYKFHSFSLECLAFLATWAVLSALADWGGRLLLPHG